MNTRCYLHPPGLVNALGSGVEQVAEMLARPPQPLPPSTPLLSGRTTRTGGVSAPLQELPKELKGYNSRNAQLLYTAFTQIRSEVERQRRRYGSDRIGVVIGTSTSGIATGETALASYLQRGAFPDGYHYRQQEAGSAAELLARAAQLQGPCYVVSAACASSGKVFASAQRLIASGLCDAVLVGGSDSLCDLTLNGFDSLESLSSERCNPFSLNRSGIHIGEGAALFLLSRDEGPVRLLGVGESSDGYHISAPEPSGQGAELALQSALDQAQLAPEQIGYINLHGTATPKNDAMESQLIQRLFAGRVPCSSSKPLTGHTLGAAAATELALCYLTLQGHPLPRHHWDQVADPELPPLPLVECEQQLTAARTCMSNSFAFGGSNVSIIIGAA